MKATVVVLPDGSSPPPMSVEGGVVAETFDALGWGVWMLDVAVGGYSVEGLRVEVKKQDPDIVVFLCNANHYRFAKQYVDPIRKELTHAVLVACTTELKPKLLMKWLPIDFAIKGLPVNQLRTLSNRTETRNFDGIPTETSTPTVAKLPEYHPMTTQFEQHTRLRNGMRFVDLPTKLFGLPVEPKDAANTIAKLRTKYAIAGFNLQGPMNVAPEWAGAFIKGLEEHELVGSPVNIKWTCEVSDLMQLTTGFIRELADHGTSHVIFEWRRDKRQQIEHVLDTTFRSQVQSIVRFSLGGSASKHDYVEMAELLGAHQNLMFATEFTENPDRYDDEEYLLSLSKGLYVPKSQNLHQDMEVLAVRDLLLNRDLARLERYAKS